MTYEQIYNCGVQGHLLTLNTAAQEVLLVYFTQIPVDAIGRALIELLSCYLGFCSFLLFQRQDMLNIDDIQVKRVSKDIAMCSN
jgi:hypothetical protein